MDKCVMSPFSQVELVYLSVLNKNVYKESKTNLNEWKTEKAALSISPNKWFLFLLIRCV